MGECDQHANQEYKLPPMPVLFTILGPHTFLYLAVTSATKTDTHTFRNIIDITIVESYVIGIWKVLYAWPLCNTILKQHPHLNTEHIIDVCTWLIDIWLFQCNAHLDYLWGSLAWSSRRSPSLDLETNQQPLDSVPEQVDGFQPLNPIGCDRWPDFGQSNHNLCNPSPNMVFRFAPVSWLSWNNTVQLQY